MKQQARSDRWPTGDDGGLQLEEVTGEMERLRLADDSALSHLTDVCNSIVTAGLWLSRCVAPKSNQLLLTRDVHRCRHMCC